MVCPICIVPFIAMAGAGMTAGGGWKTWLLWGGLSLIMIALSIFLYYYFIKKKCNKDDDTCPISNKK